MSSSRLLMGLGRMLGREGRGGGGGGGGGMSGLVCTLMTNISSLLLR